MNIVEKLSRAAVEGKNVPDFRSGDTVRVNCRIQEGNKERIQAFEGVVIKRQRGGIHSSFTVRKHSYGVGVERVFPLYAPSIESIEVVTRGQVRRSRLHYLRNLRGKAARIKAKRWEEVEVEVVEVPEASPEASEEKDAQAASS